MSRKSKARRKSEASGRSGGGSWSRKRRGRGGFCRSWTLQGYRRVNRCRASRTSRRIGASGRSRDGGCLNAGAGIFTMRAVLATHTRGVVVVLELRTRKARHVRWNLGIPFLPLFIVEVEGAFTARAVRESSVSVTLTLSSGSHGASRLLTCVRNL